MSTGYIRNDTSDNISNGNIINASDLDGEFNAIQAAFDLSSGHQHDGTTGNGAPIITLGSNQEFVATSTALRPLNDNSLDLGTTILEFKNLYLDGVANVDTLQVDENATITGDLSVQGNTTLGNADTDTITLTGRFVSTLTPGVDNTYDLGTSSLQWRNLEIDGIASIDTLQVDENASVTGTLGVTGVTTLGSMTATMTGGTINGTIIGGTTAAAGTFTTLTATAGSITGITDLAVADGGTGASNSLQGLGSLLGYTTTATAAGTTTLTNSSSPIQYFTGTTTQTVVLPSAVNALPGATYFIYNNSTGSLTVNANNAALVCTIAANEIWNITCNSSTGTTPASWTATRVSAGSGISLVYTSSDQTITTQGLLTLAHGFGVIPKLAGLELVCQTAEANYAIGNVTTASLNNYAPALGAAWNSVRYDATNVYIRFSPLTNCFTVANALGGGQQALTNANWKLRVRAFA